MSAGRTNSPDVATSARASALVWWIVTLGIALRFFHFLRDPSVWHDEAALVLNVLQKGFAELLGPLLFAEASPPLFLWIERAAVLLLGDGTYALRLASLLGSCLAVILMVPLARRILRPAAVPWAVFLLAISDRLLWHACEAKPYSLDVLAAVALPALFVSTRHWATIPRLAIFALLAPIVIFLVYPGCFLYGGVLVALLPGVLEGKVGRARLMYGVLALTVFISFGLLLAGPIRAQCCPTLSECWEPTFPDCRHPWTLPGWAVWSTVRIADYCCRPIGGVLVLLGAFGVMSLQKRQPLALTLLTLPLLLAMVAALIRAYPYFGARVMVYAAPAVCLLVAEGVPSVVAFMRRCADRFGQAPPLTSLVLASPRIALYALLLVPACRTAYRVVLPWERPDVAGATEYVLSHRRPDDVVIASSWEHLYYFRHLGSALVTPGGVFQQPAGRLWVVVTGKISSEERLEIAQVLSRDSQTLTRREFQDTTVLLTERNKSEVHRTPEARGLASGLGVKPRHTDDVLSLRAARRAIRAATYPPLKPLSMFTTTTLAEQLFSMVSSGATPENAAP
jgi:hypothetical protein